MSPAVRTFGALVAIVFVVSSTGVAAEPQARTPPIAPADSARNPAPPAAAAARRAPDGRPAIAAARVTSPIAIDGALDDAAWRTAEIAEGFVQSEPAAGQPSTERTTVQLLTDGRTIYVGAMLYDSSPAGIIVNDLRKDFFFTNQDTFQVIFDSFGDRRNGFLFATNSAGARADQQITNEGRDTNASWDAAWTVRTRRLANGWSVEMAIPLTSLRFEPGRDWGVNFARTIRRKNEIAYWAPVPRSFSLARVSLAGLLEGVSDAKPGRNLQIKPYALGGAVRPPGSSEFDSTSNAGLDVKYAITPGLTLDVTARPDFAQAEADEQQVNLTQFSQFFPEKRSFFLENAGLFYVGDTARNRMNPTPTPDEDLLLFFSRRIGLSPTGAAIPIVAGARLTGRAAGLQIGALSIQTESTPSTPANNYSVLRARRNLFGSSDIGAIFMQRANTDSAGDTNRVYGVDANIRPFGILDWSSYVMKSDTPGAGPGQYAARTSVNWEGPFFHGKVGVLVIGKGFRDDLAYIRRTNIRKYLIDVGVRPRPAWLGRYGMREMHPHIAGSIYTDPSGLLVARSIHAGYTFSGKSGSFAELSINPEAQRLERPLTLAAGVAPLPAGYYEWTPWRLFLSSNSSRTWSVSSQTGWGGLWNGTQTSIQGTVTYRPNAALRVSLGLARTAATLRQPNRSFVTSITTLRANYSFSTAMFLDALVQHNRASGQINTNIRFNVMHRPLSDLYIVYNEQRFTTDGTPPGRGVIVKFSQMFGF